MGLYVFCRQAVFTSCSELTPALTQLIPSSSSGSKLRLVAGEVHPTNRKDGLMLEQKDVVEVDGVSAMGLLVYQLAQSKAISTTTEV